MKHGKGIAILVAVFVLILVAAVIVYIRYDKTTDKMSVDLYYINQDGTSIVAKTQTIRYKNDEDLIREALEKLKKSGSSNLGAIMPKETQIKAIELSGGFLTVHFSDEFLKEDSSRNVLNVYAVVKTMCSTGRATSVKVLVNGEPIKNREGEPLEFISASDINLETEEYVSEMREVKLYFADTSEKKLVCETRTIKITDQQPIEQYIINELIKGTKNKDMKSLLSGKTALVSVDIDEDVCYLNFKSEFLADNAGSDTHEKLVIYSIVNSLTELDLHTIARVQFYMDGKRVEKFGSVKIKDYIQRNTEIIQEEEIQQ